jgi:hypothetical protein
MLLGEGLERNFFRKNEFAFIECYVAEVRALW